MDGEPVECEGMYAAVMIMVLAGACGQHPPASRLPKPAGGGVDIERAREAVREKLSELHRGGSFPGLTAGFVLPDGSAGGVAVGIADPARKVAMQLSDRMLAGSIGKTFVSALALQLIDEGRLELDAKIGRWLGAEGWFARLPNGPDITLRTLLNHTSGIPEHVYDPAFIRALLEQPDRVWTPPELVSHVLGKRPLFPAGLGWSYADTNYIVLGMIIERVTGRTLYDEIDRRLLRPLKLENTSPSISRVIPGLVPGHMRQGGPFQIGGSTIHEGKLRINPQCEWAGGGYVSTAADLARWGRNLYEGDVLKPPVLEQLLAGVPARTGRGDRYGLGVQIRQSPWGPSYGHGGWFPGYLSELEYFAGPRIAVAVQFNTDDVNSLGRSPRTYIAEAALAILRFVPEYPVTERADRPRVFAPGVVSTEDDEVGGAFNPEQTEFYFSKLAPYTTSPRIGVLCVSQRRDGRWMTPEALPFSGRWLDLPPRLSPDGKIMYFASSRPLEGSRARLLRIWAVEREGAGWGEPKVLPPPINDEASSNWGASVAADGTLYFTSTRDPSGRLRIFRVRPAGAGYSPPELLGPEINSDCHESDPFISPDGERLYFVSTGQDGTPARPRRGALATGGFPYPRGEIYASRLVGGKWTPARHLGLGVNTVAEESSPTLSPDGKFLFYTSERSAFVVPTERRMDYDRLESTLRSIENGHGNVMYVSVDAPMLEEPP
jgi:D-alanyl-D-alanine carboxypeptidase